MVSNKNQRVATYAARVAQAGLAIAVFTPILDRIYIGVAQYERPFYGLLFGGAVALLLMNGTEAITKLIKGNLWLWLFMLYAGASIGWSANPDDSVKRFSQLLGFSIMGLALVAPGVYAFPLTRTLRPVLSLAIVLSVITVLALPTYAIHMGDAWRGVTHHKNALGNLAVLCLILWAHTFRSEQQKRGSALFFCVLSLVVTVFSRSTTAVITLFLILILLTVSFLRNKLESAWTFVWLLGIMVFGSIAHVLSIIYGYTSPSEAASTVAAFFGKDLTLTGRTDLWVLIWNEAIQRYWLGVGYGGFWIDDEARTILSDASWVPRQAHNGYLDIFNELGVIGFGIMVMLIISHVRQLLRLYPLDRQAAQLHIIILLSVLLMNISESMLFRTANLWSIVFVFSIIEVPYLITAAEAHKKVNSKFANPVVT